MGLFNQLLFSQKSDIDTGLVGHWALDEGSGTTTGDSSGNGFNMTLTNSPTWVVGQVGSHALNFSGSSYAQTANDTSLIQLGGTRSLSVAAWFKTTTTPTASMSGLCITQGGISDGTYDKGIGATLTGKAGFYYFQSPSAHIISGSTTITDGNWHHICAVFNGQTKQVQMFVDGRLENYQAATSTFQFAATYVVCSLVEGGGAGGAIGTFQSFSGSIDDIRFYNRALTPQDIKALYSYSGDDLTTGLVVYYKFDEGTGTSSFDSSGHGRTGTLEHSPAWVSGKIGPFAIKTQTTNDLVTVSPFPMTGSWTISTWTLFPQSAFNCALTRDGAASGSGNVHVYVNSKILGCYMASDGTAFHSSGYDTTALSGWHHIAAVGSGSKTTFYVDAAFVGTSSAQATDNIDTIGNNIQSSNQPWGTFDDFRIYSRALAPTDITALYNFR